MSCGRGVNNLECWTCWYEPVTYRHCRGSRPQKALLRIIKILEYLSQIIGVFTVCGGGGEYITGCGDSKQYDAFCDEE